MPSFRGSYLTMIITAIMVGFGWIIGQRLAGRMPFV